jgi:hypothetical protein
LVAQIPEKAQQPDGGIPAMRMRHNEALGPVAQQTFLLDFGEHICKWLITGQMRITARPLKVADLCCGKLLFDDCS